RLGGLIVPDAGTIDVMSVYMPPVPALVREGPVVLGGNLDADGVASTGSVTVVGDLDLTNVDELQALVGHDARGADLVVRLYLWEGSRFLRRLHGGFALALW